MIFQNSMGSEKSKCDILNDTTQEWAFPLNNKLQINKILEIVISYLLSSL